MDQNQKSKSKIKSLKDVEASFKFYFDAVDDSTNIIVDKLQVASSIQVTVSVVFWDNQCWIRFKLELFTMLILLYVVEVISTVLSNGAVSSLYECSLTHCCA